MFAGIWSSCAITRETSAGGVELALALAGLGGEVPHKVLVGVAQEVVPFSSGAGEVNVLEDADQVRDLVLQLLAGAQLGGVVEVCVVDDAQQVVLFGETPDRDVDLLAYVGLPFERDQVVERAVVGDVDERRLVCLRLVGDILHEQQREDVVLVLAGVHRPAQLVSTAPQ
ncbi:hypothetical protein HNP00_003528 [Arthrobacter sp. AZCC_0090]|nr:hypothetical protein [Arthrobacter sp. AZCC_0090]